MVGQAHDGGATLVRCVLLVAEAGGVRPQQRVYLMPAGPDLGEHVPGQLRHERCARGRIDIGEACRRVRVQIGAGVQ